MSKGIPKAKKVFRVTGGWCGYTVHGLGYKKVVAGRTEADTLAEGMNLAYALGVLKGAR